MAIVSGFVREDRIAEVDGCPLSDRVNVGDESACANCRYNALNPGKARVGCLLNTKAVAYEQSMQRLKSISLNDFQTLINILTTARTRGQGPTLSDAEVKTVLDVARRWWTLVGNDPAERTVVAAILRFCEASLSEHEPIKILA